MTAGASPKARFAPSPDERLVDMIFVSMPYAAIERPSLALGTLAAALAREGVTAHTIHGNMMFAERIGAAHYETFNSSDITMQMGEWTFSEAAFGSFGDVEAYIELLTGVGMPGDSLRNALLSARVIANAFVADLAAEIVAKRPRMLGCSSVFQQNCASLALLRQVRALDPGIITLLGGANCEGQMGIATHRHYPWVDYVVSGEADHLLAGLCHQIIAQGRDVPVEELAYGVIGPRCRSDGEDLVRQEPPRALINNLDELPIPDFDDYFDQLALSPLRKSILPGLPVETSRGCWWGAKHHCTFCGLNGAGLAFRAKSEARAKEEILALGERYHLNRFMTVDNILDLKYFRNLLPDLADNYDNLFFYETKANLTRAQVELLSRAGVRWIQPGIEALHDGLLKLLKKGCSAAINVQLLKWAYNNGIWVMWNHLHGAPGEDYEWYEKVAELLPKLAHLQPPLGGSMTPIRFDRFSPYFDNAASFGLRLEPYPAYSHVYPLPIEQIADQAYFFRDATPPDPVPVALAVNMFVWGRDFYEQRDHAGILPGRSAEAPVLAMTDHGAHIEIRDTRACAKAALHVLSPIESEICRASDAARDRDAIATQVSKRFAEVTPDEIETACRRLVDVAILAEFGDTLLCLAADAEPEPYKDFHDYAGGLLLFPKRRAEPEVSIDPWATPVSEMFASP
ncbi:MAG: RiPP maturation radical SAM protein 1 [Sphingomonadales bacterium]|nr:MAG: RiPP maturation radical SAM protein 1 [Sphingomonadales bacterium]